MFPYLQHVQEPLISDFLSHVPSTFIEAYDRLVNDFSKKNSNLSSIQTGTSRIDKFGVSNLNTESPIGERVLSNRIMMLQLINKFHREAGTITKTVDHAVKDLEDPSTRILVSTHQPNLFAYGGIFKKVVLLQTLKDLLLDSDNGHDSLKIINLFVVIDHDFADENWIRVAQLPSVRNTDGIMELRLPVDKSRRWQMVCNMPLPNRTVLDHWRRQLYSWINKSFLFQPGLFSTADLSHHTEKNFKNLESIRSALISNLEIFWDLVEESYSTANTYSNFNAFLMSKIVNKFWQYDTLFIRLTDLAKVFVRGYGNLLRNYDDYSKTLREMEQVFLRRGVPSGVSSSSYLNSPLWLHCKCGSKSATKILDRQVTTEGLELALEGDCMGCKKHLRAELLIGEEGEITSPHGQIVNELSPRSIPIVLLLASELGISCYASGTDGMRYIVFGNCLFKQFSPKNIPMFMVWPARDVYYGFSQSEALRSLQLRNYDDIGECIKTLKEKEEGYRSLIAPILCERNQRVKQSQSAEDEILSVLFSLKKEQRIIRSQYKLAEKVENALNLRPSVIDYAINFGLEDTESQWRQNLLYSNNLISPIKLLSKFNYLE
jgi:hypothetical protein